MSDAPNDISALIARVRKNHVSIALTRYRPLVCDMCVDADNDLKPWPCDVIRLADALEAAQADTARLDWLERARWMAYGDAWHEVEPRPGYIGARADWIVHPNLPPDPKTGEYVHRNEYFATLREALDARRGAIQHEAQP